MNDDGVYTGYESAFVPTPGGTVYNDETPTQPVNTSQNQPQNKQSTGTYESIMGKRYFNPLSRYSSYTYQLSLYMITPDAYDVFVNNGRRSIEIVNQAGAGCGGGAYLIAQSGGINNTSSLRAPGFHYDFGIDNLVIDAVISPNGIGAPTTNTQLSFTIIEQYGFSFITNLKRAKEALDLYSTTVNLKDSTNASKQFFVLGIKFLGYDEFGNVINSNDPSDTFERYYDIYFNEVQFKIDGKATTYQIKAVCVPPQVALGQKRGVIDQGAPQLKGSTVEEICNALIKKLNDDQAKQVPNSREFPNIYKIEFIDDAIEIAKSSIVSSADVSKIKWPMASPTTSGEVNPGLSIGATPNNNQRVVSFNRDTPIIQAIQQIINQSDFLIKGLKAVYNTDAQPDKEGNKEPIDSNKRAKWFNISTITSQAKFDRKTKDFAFTITYQVRTYETPVVVSTAADRTAQYYGPFKRYDYWLTGKNTEVIRYEQTMNNAFFTVAVDTMNTENSNGQGTGGNAQVPVATNKRTSAQRLGKLDIGMEAQNNYVTSLVDPGAYAKSSVTILGDPDLLSNDMPTGNPDLDSGRPFYGPDGYSIDPKKGQCFVEIDFKEAVDYDHQTGYLRVNDKILFWEYPPEIQKKVKGICFQLNGVKSTFRGGKFTQDLDLVMAMFGNETPYSQTAEGREEARQEEANQQETQRLAKKGNPPVGLTQDKPVGSTANGDACGPAAAPQASSNQQTKQNGVADDDANANSSPPPITGEPNQEVPGGTISSLGVGA